MAKKAFIRARKPAEKEVRRSAILSAAAKLLERDQLCNVSLSGIARAAKLAKSNLYRYFESREEIFLHLLADAQTEWATAVEDALAPHAGIDDPDLVGRLLTETAINTPRLCELSASMAAVLEQNLSEDIVLWFKEGTARLSVRIGNAVHAALPGFPQAESRRLVRFLYSAVAGLWPSAHPSPTVAKVMAKPQMAQHRCDFALELETMACALLRGMSQPASR